MKLQTKLLLAILSLFLLLFGVGEYLDYRHIRAEHRQALLQQARSFRNLLISTRRVYHRQFLRSEIPVTDKTVGFLPAHALCRISGDFGSLDGTGMYFNNVSDTPRNPDNRADAVQQEAIDFFSSHPEAEERFASFVAEDGIPYYHFSTPLRTEAYCLECHGERREAPAAIRDRYDAGFGRRVGELAGILSIKLPAAAMQRDMEAHLKRNAVVNLGGFSLAFFSISLLLRICVTGRLQRLKSAALAMQQGEYGRGTEICGKDELAELSSAFDAMAAAIAGREESLRESEARLRAVIDSARDAIVIADEEHLIRGFNPAAVKMFGFSEEEALGRELTLLIPPEEHGSHRMGYLRVLEGHRSEMPPGNPVEIVARRKDGTTFPGEVALSSTSVEGRFRVIGIVRDITGRKRTDEALRGALAEAEASRNQVQNILKSVADGLIVCDGGGRVLLMNQAAEAMVGATFAMADRQPAVALFDDGSLRKRFSALLDGGPSGPGQVDLELSRPGAARPRVIQARISAMENAPGEGTGTVTILRDVTREREVESLKSEFISMAAHELRTPLTSLMGYVELLLKPEDFGVFDPAQRTEFLAEIYDKGEALTKITDDLLDISRIEAGLPIPLEKSRCKLLEIVEKLVARYRHQAPGHRFEINWGPGAEALALDRSKIVQVLENLLSNAVKYSPRGGTVRVSGRSEGGAFRVAVRDEGIGIPPEEATRIFDRFYRVDSSDTAAGGLGLGLSIVKHIVLQHGGRVGVENLSGGGASVFFTLPAV